MLTALSMWATEFRYAVRSLRRSPWYAAGVIGVLALGLSLATVTFAVVDGVLFKPLPYSRANELFLIRADVSSDPQPQPPPVSSRDIDAWITAVPGVPVTVVSLDRIPDTRGNRERISAAIDEHFFAVLGLRPALGGFTPDDFSMAWRDQQVSLWPMLISYQDWQHKYGGDPKVVGRIEIARTEEGGRQFGRRIAGVLPETFVLPIDGREVSAVSPHSRRDAGGDRLYVLARVPVSEAAGVQARLLGATRRAATQAPVFDGHSTGERRLAQPFDTVALLPISQHLAARERPAFALVFSATALLLLLAGVNVAGLAAARNVERRADRAIRQALGAGRRHLLQGLLAELGLLTVAALAAALLLAQPLLWWTVDLLPASVSVLKEPALDARVFAGSACLAVLCLMIVSSWPALVAFRSDPRLSLHAATTTTPRARLSGNLLISAQVAIGFVLLIAGGLTVVSVAEAYRNDTGYRRSHAIVLEVYAQKPPGSSTPVEVLRSLPATLANVPGVDQVAISTINPLFAQRLNAWTEVVPEGWTGNISGVVSRKVSDNFFEVFGVRLTSGRWPGPGEWRADQPVALVSETAARTLWPDRPAIGQILVARSGPARIRRTVIGVVGDARFAGLETAPVGDVYLPDPLAESGRTGVFFHVSTTTAAADTLPAVLAALGGRGLMITQASTHEDALFASVKHRVLPAWLFGSLGGGALAMLAAGVLGLLAMSVAQRTREIGIRMALGASPGRVVRSLVREQATPVAVGILAGMLISAWTVRLLEAQLYGVGRHDPGVWIGVGVVLLVVATLAALVPSSRAARVNPAEVLRNT